MALWKKGNYDFGHWEEEEEERGEKQRDATGKTSKY